MTDKEKVEKALERINEEGLRKRRIKPGRIYESMKDTTLYEIAV